MQSEIEARWTSVDPVKVRAMVQKHGGKKVHDRLLMKRYVYVNKRPGQTDLLRVRTEHNKITMTYKHISEQARFGVKELEFHVDDFDKANEFIRVLSQFGVKFSYITYQESYREKYVIDGCEFTIDEWPLLDPMVEIECKDEATVFRIAKLIGLDPAKAHTQGTVADTYKALGVQLELVETLSFEKVPELQKKFNLGPATRLSGPSRAVGRKKKASRPSKKTVKKASRRKGSRAK